MKKMISLIIPLLLLLSMFTSSAFAASEMVTYNWPLKISNPEKKITDNACHKSETGKYTGSWAHQNNCHFGTDFGVGSGTEVYSTSKGTVTFAGTKSGYDGYGKFIVIKHPDGKYSLYGHLSSYSVSKGDTVKQGSLIGKSGSTGYVSGACLHFGIYKVNPLGFYESSVSTKSELYKKIYDPVQIVKPHVIHFELNGANGNFPDKEAKYGSVFKLPTATPSMTGKVFKGWWLKRLKDQTWYVAGHGWCTADEISKNNYSRKLYSAGDSLNIDDSWINGCTDYTNYRFDAQFATATYTVQYNANGGSGAPASQTKTYGKTLTLQNGKPTRSNYTFVGWATSANATSAQYYPGGSYTANSNVTLYAVWKAVAHTHAWGEWKTTVAPTTTSYGVQERVCSTCGAVERRDVEKLPSNENNQTDGYNAPTESITPSITTVVPDITVSPEVMDLPAVKITKPKAAKKSVTVKWKKVSKKNQKKIAKIQIQYSMDPTFTIGVKTTTAKKSATFKKIKKLAPKKTYYVRVRAYKASGNVTHVSKWSSVKRIKVK